MTLDTLLKILLEWSFDFYQFDRFVARTFDHGGARVSELVWPTQTFNPLTAIAKFPLLT
jgi:hypothetical protein